MYFVSIWKTGALTPGEVIVLSFTSTSIDITWGTGDDLPGYQDFFLQIDPPASSNPVVNREGRTATYNDLSPGEEYTITVTLFADTNVEQTAVQRTSKSNGLGWRSQNFRRFEDDDGRKLHLNCYSLRCCSFGEMSKQNCLSQWDESYFSMYNIFTLKGLYTFCRQKTKCPQIYTKLTQFEDNDSRKLPWKYYVLRCCSFGDMSKTMP